jgi:hypothetical protein
MVNSEEDSKRFDLSGPDLGALSMRPIISALYHAYCRTAWRGGSAIDPECVPEELAKS